MNSTLHTQTSEPRLPEDVLRIFVDRLKDPMDLIEYSLLDFPNHATLNDSQEIFAHIEQALQSINENVRAVIEYLHLKLKNEDDFAEEKIALKILGEFSHVLRECSMPMMGFINIVQKCELSKDEFEHYTETITYYGQRLLSTFKTLHSNWQTWLENKKFDWEAGDL